MPEPKYNRLTGADKRYDAESKHPEGKHYLFVYGTLMDANLEINVNGILLPDAVKKSSPVAVLHGFELYDTGYGFPAAIRADLDASNTEDRTPILGMVAAIDDEQLKAIDRYEGVERGLYKRVLVKVHLPEEQTPDTTLIAYAYVTEKDNPSFPNLTPIKTGSWLHHTPVITSKNRA